MTDAEAAAAANQGQAQQLWLLRDSREKLRIRELHVGEAGIDVRRARGVQQTGEPKTVDEPLDLAGSHGLLFEIDEMNRNAALFEEPLGGAHGR